MPSIETLTALKQEYAEVEKRRVEAEREALALKQAISVLEGNSFLIADTVPKLDFSGLGIVEAARRLVKEVGHPLTTNEIAAEILKRGVVTTSKHYVPTVYATLDNAPDFVRLGSGRKGKWDLKENRG